MAYDFENASGVRHKNLVIAPAIVGTSAPNTHIPPELFGAQASVAINIYIQIRALPPLWIFFSQSGNFFISNFLKFCALVLAGVDGGRYRHRGASFFLPENYRSSLEIFADALRDFIRNQSARRREGKHAACADIFRLGNFKVRYSSRWFLCG